MGFILTGNIINIKYNTFLKQLQKKIPQIKYYKLMFKLIVYTKF